MTWRRSIWLTAALLCFAPLRAADRSVAPIVSRIPRAPVNSSGLAAIGYSRSLHALEVEFRDGLTYRYLDVPLENYRRMMAADSKTRFYNRHIRGKYRCLRVKRKPGP